MAEAVTVARPYAEAIFRLARESGTLSEWSQRLGFLAAVARDPGMQALIASPELSAAQRESLFLTVGEGRLDEPGRRLVRVLAENGRLGLLPAIAERFEELKAEHEGVLEASIYSAYPLTHEQAKALIARLERRYRRRIVARVVVEPALIGGVQVHIGDQVLDASVRGKLQALAVALQG